VSAGGIRSTARSLRLGAERARFEVWARRLDARLRRAGGRLVLEAPHGAHFYELPAVEVHPYGDAAGSLTLRIGRDVHLGRGLILEIWAAAPTVIELGDEVSLQAGTRLRVRGGAGTIRIGARTHIRDYVFLDATGEIAIGRSVQIGAQVALHAAERVQIGDDVTIGERTSFFDSDHQHDGGDEPVLDQPRAIGPIAVGANTFIGANSLVLRDVEIGRRTIVAGGSVVRAGTYEGGHLYAGSPLTAVRPLGPSEKPHE
jgi:acetyltransferase-like isoleucine patch superfamily enzyme